MNPGDFGGDIGGAGRKEHRTHGNKTSKSRFHNSIIVSGQLAALILTAPIN
jgi:hypothetical protein